MLFYGVYNPGVYTPGVSAPRSSKAEPIPKSLATSLYLLLYYTDFLITFLPDTWPGHLPLDISLYLR